MAPRRPVGRVKRPIITACMRAVTHSRHASFFGAWGGMERYNFSVRVKHYAAHNGRGCTHGCTLSLSFACSEAVKAFRIASPGDSLVTEVTSALGTPPHVVQVAKLVDPDFVSQPPSLALRPNSSPCAG